MRSRVVLVFLIIGFISMASTIDLDNLFPYATQEIPEYVERDNTPDLNPITDEGALLGRVLFYDKQLSRNNTISCASCHKQEFAFGDTALLSIGVQGLTGRHSMRLVNARFSDESNFFWDERAGSLEEQSTMPIKDHFEMGFSGFGNDPTIDSLLERIAQIDYYQQLFPFVFGDNLITEERIGLALSQFIRSIQSFDTRFDEGFAQVAAPLQPFPNFTPQENLGKQLFLQPIPLGGAGCAGCHVPPEFNIDPESLNNGVIGMAGTSETDLTNTKSPSLRELFRLDGSENGPFMHDGSLSTLEDVINHYDFIPPNPANTNLDPRLAGGPNGQGQNLNLGGGEKAALYAFLQTLSGSEIYEGAQWSDPFGPNGELTLIGGLTGVADADDKPEIHIYPNPFRDEVRIDLGTQHRSKLSIFNLNGESLASFSVSNQERITMPELPNGVYLFVFEMGSQTKSVKALKIR